MSELSTAWLWSFIFLPGHLRTAVVESPEMFFKFLALKRFYILIEIIHIHILAIRLLFLMYFYMIIP